MSDEAEKKPWWNDGDTIGAIFATSVFIAFLFLFLTLVAKLAIWLITGEWTL